MFLNGSNKPFTASQMNRTFGDIVKRFNEANPDNPIPAISCHTFRHSCCTHFAKNGMDIKVLQNLMGHADSSITLNAYNHGYDERTKEEFLRVENLVI